ncbi:hypothetical protein THRCLA_04429 [Thraustotheca clavata]|uniref:VPS9 domain-containing protein n=1 Tax=Thraustotheca clavata TaxID=74557 RepID=A0A1V9ZZ16_9STRA|nr:hypothetical protein THRCLA_04429 [Thraustotheca clavata]
MDDPFLRSFQANLPVLLKKIHVQVDTKCLICIPQSVSLLSGVITINDLETHFLLPDAKLGQYQTLNGKHVAIAGTHIHTKNGFREPRIVRILITEEYPIDKPLLHLSVLHLNRPLEGGVIVPEDITEMDVGTFRRYIAMLRTYPESGAVFHSLDYFVQQVESYPSSHNVFRPQSIKRVWRQSLDILLDNGALDITSSSHSQRLIQLEQAIESYIMEQLHDIIFERIQNSCQSEQRQFEQSCLKLKYATPATFKIQLEYQCEQLEAIECLQNAFTQRTPLDMLLQFKKAIQFLQEAIHANLLRHNLPIGTFHLSTDDVLDQLLFIIAQVTKLYPQFPLVTMMKYMEDYRFVPSNLSALGFTLANFQVALEWFFNLDSDDSIIQKFPTHPKVHLSSIEPTDCVEIINSEPPFEIIITGMANRLKIDQEVYQMACGHRYFAYVTENGQVWTWGDAYGGRLGYAQSMNRVENPQRIIAFADVKVMQVACGAFHMLACDLDGRVYAWGSNSNGQLGLGDSSSNSVITPRVIQDLRGNYICAVACGDSHSLALSSQGSVYSWGCNRFFQLGRTSTIENAFTPSLVEKSWFGTDIFGVRRVDKSIGDSVDINEPGAALCIAAGSYHSLVIARDGTLFTWGCGRNGQLGHGSIMDIKLPLEVLALSQERVICAGGGPSYSCALLKSGHIVACGLLDPAIPELGFNFKEVKLPHPVRRVTFGQHHCVFVLADGNLIVWGSNVHGQCNLFDGILDSTVPDPVQVPTSKSILHVAAGASHTIILTKTSTK